MKIFSAYQQGLAATFQHKKMWLCLYLLNFGFALLAALPFSNLIESRLGNSLIVNKLMDGFSYTVLMDFYYEYLESIWVVIDQSIYLIIAFLLLYIFLSGGILSTFLNSEASFSFKRFWAGCGQFFWRFFRLTVYFLIFHGILFFTFFLIFMTWIKWADPNRLISEVTLLTAGKTLTPIYLLLATLLSMIQDYAKIQIIQDNPKIFTHSVVNSLKLVFTNFKKTVGLYFLVVFSSLLVIALYALLQNMFSNSTGMGIFLLFLLGQMFLLARIGIKLLNFASASSMFQALK